MEWIKENWATLLPVLNVTLIPLAIWLGKKIDRRSQRAEAHAEKQEAHEERRTKAQEQLPREIRRIRGSLVRAVREQAEATRTAIASEAKLTREHIDATSGRILEAIKADKMAEIKKLLEGLDERLTPIPPAPTQNHEGPNSQGPRRLG